MADKFYCISKLTLGDNGLIESVYAYEAKDGEIVNEIGSRDRAWLLSKYGKYDLKQIDKNIEDTWDVTANFKYDGNYFSWGKILPKNLPRRKTFISFYHKDDEEARNKFEILFGDLVVAKWVDDGDIDSDNSDEYIKQLIHKEYLHDTTVLIVLVGPNTKCRKHVDWEIGGALNFKVGDKYAGLLGLELESSSGFGTGKYDPLAMPKRLAANAKSGYATIADWTTDRVAMQNLIERVFAKRENDEKIVNIGIPQLTKNECD